jgi:predicted nucleic acid-binding protein
MKVYFDTNIVIDIIEKREPFFKYSYAVFLMAAERKIEDIIGASAITDIYYIVRRSRKSKKDALAAVIEDETFVEPDKKPGNNDNPSK